MKKDRINSCKKAISVALSAVLLTAAFVPCAAAAADASAQAYPLLREDILIRDPFVLVYEGKYYMYGTGLKWNGYGCVTSEDLEHWTEPQWVFQAPAGFDGEGDWWAPECHFYNGSFYLFATYRSAASGKRGTAVFRADTPLGPFEPLSDGHVTPKHRDCIDGTLYVDDRGQPWIVFVGEWTSNADGVGDMCAARLSDDLREMISEPVTLFRGTDARWATGKITDGPFLYRTDAGRLLMLWSNFAKEGYAVGLARSSDNTLCGKWTQDVTPLYQKDRSHALDGGHGMIFTDLDGNERMAIHSPNQSTEDRFETARFLYVADLGFTLAATERPVRESRLFNALKAFCAKILRAFAKLRDTFAAFTKKTCCE